MLKARDNPFASDRLERRLKFVPEWAGLSWESIDRRLERYQWRCAILGTHGSGKTTLIDALDVRCRQRGLDVSRLFFNDQRPPRTRTMLDLRRTAGPETVLICDGAEQLNVFQWLTLRWGAARARGLIVTTHHRSHLPIAIRLTVTRKLVETVLHDIDATVDWSGKVPDLIRLHDGNVREIIRACYFAAVVRAECDS